MQGDVVCRLAKLLALGNEIGLAGQLHQDSHHRTVVLDVDVAADGALVCLAVGPLCHLGLAPLPEQLERLLQVSACIGESRLGVHHPDTGVLSQLLDVLGAELSHSQRSPSWAPRRLHWRR